MYVHMYTHLKKLSESTLRTYESHIIHKNFLTSDLLLIYLVQN